METMWLAQCACGSGEGDGMARDELNDVREGGRVSYSVLLGNRLQTLVDLLFC